MITSRSRRRTHDSGADLGQQALMAEWLRVVKAAHAGDAGRGFAIVASEVKKLADTTTHATEQITEQVHTLQAATRASAALMDSVETTVQEMSPMAEAIRIAVDGSSAGSAYADEVGQIMGLAKMAELLRSEVCSFLAHMRNPAG